MPYITIGSTSQLQIQVPTRTTTGWDETLRTNTFVKISEHDHSGVSGKGIQISTAALAADSVIDTKILLSNNAYLRGRNAANSADINIIKVNTGDTLTLGTSVLSPTLVTPVLGVATATTINKLTITAPATASTLTVAEGSSLITSGANSLTLTTTAASNVTLPTTGTLSTLAGSETLTNKTLTGNIAVNLVSGAATVTLPTTTSTLSTLALSETLTNKSIDADTNTITNIENADIKAAAAIAVNKLAATTASRALVSDASGFLTAATTTSTEIGYVNGLTSSAQTQLDAKIAKSLVTTKGDLIAATASATPARLGVGTNGFVLVADSAESTGLKWQSAAGAFANPTIQKFTSGSGTYTTAANALYIKVLIVGGGGGGGGSGSSGGGTGGTGGTSTFGTTMFSCVGGTGGGPPIENVGGVGGTATLGTGPIGTAISGGSGQGGQPVASNFNGGPGGNNSLSGAGANGVNGAGQAGIANTGGGGQGGGGSGSSFNASGGGAGGFALGIIGSPAASYSYAIGAAGTAGTAGTAGNAGGAGGSGYIEVTEYYQ